MRKFSEIMVNRLPITKARVNLGQLAKRAHVNKECFILERDGIPVIGIMDADELEDYLELRHPKVQANIATVRGEYQAGKGRPSIGLLDELKAASKRSRKQSARSKRP